MRNDFLTGLYDMGKESINGVDKLNEEKLKKELEKSMDKNFLRPNKKIFEEQEYRFSKCKRYSPCPICEKCKNKASHLYISCQRCTIPICVHTYKTMTKMIIRRNFIQKPSKIWKKEFEKLK